MNIDRRNIISELFDFSQKGNGVIIGKPGIGKSYSIGELGLYLANQNIPAIILPIDDLPDGSDESIERFLETGEDDWINYIDRIKPLEGARAVLVFDAFDAARDGKLRKDILKQLKKAVSRLEKWNVLVSIRTYDATKSPELLRLFGDENTKTEISCRHYEIPELNESELESVFKDNSIMDQFYGSLKDEQLKKILRIPFFLKLLEFVLKDTDEGEREELKVIKSKTQLLDRYWDKKITNTELSYQKESLLTKIAKSLVEVKGMSCPKEPFVSDVETFKVLRSDDLINEVGVGQRNIAFSHNILFDYIVGRVVIPADAKELVAFIQEEASRPFFLRPSFIFHFTRLWYSYRDEFWENFALLKTEESADILLFRRLIPTSVVANEFQEIEELDPIISENESIKQLLQSIRFLSDGKLQKRYVDLLYKLRERIDFAFLSDYCFVFEKVLDSEEADVSNQKLGEIARSILRYILRYQISSEERNQQLDRLGGTRGVDFVAKTFDSNIAASTTLLREVLDLLDESDFEIWYFSSLSGMVEHIINAAPEFVSEIYERIFLHKEDSNAETYMGSVTMNFVSNRRQDFEMCHYRLVKSFPKFLLGASEDAIKTGLKIVNDYVIHDKLHIEKLDKKELRSVGVKSIRSSFLPDYSSIWHESLTYHRPAQLVEKIIEFLRRLMDKEDVANVYRLLDVYVSKAVVGLTWKKLIEFANDYPDKLQDYLFELALNPVILKSSETIFEIGVSLERIFPNLERKSQKILEEAIVGLANVEDETEKEYAEHDVIKLLNCIPRGLLQSKKALRIVKQAEPIKNEPTSNFTVTEEPYSTENWLEEHGVNVEDDTNRVIIEYLNRIEQFNRQRMNQSPIRSQFVDFLPDASRLFGQIKNKEISDDELKLSALRNVAQFYSIITRKRSEINKHDYENAKEAIQFSFDFISKYDEGFDESSSPASGYSPTPRIDAAGAFIGLFTFKQDEDILENIKEGVADKNPIIRFNVLRNIALLWSLKPEEYWQIVLERLSNEPDSFTISTILNNVFRNDIIEVEEKIVEAIEITAKRISEFGKLDSFTKAFTGLLLYLMDNKKNKVAKEIIYEHIEDTDFIEGLVFRLFDFIDPKYRQNDYTQENTRKELIQLFNDIASRNLELLKNDDPVKFSEKGTKEHQRLMLIDFIIQRIYFGLDVNERIRNKNELHPGEKNKRAFYDRVKPILVNVVDSSKSIGDGIIYAHTAHYFIETLNGVLKFYPEEAEAVLKMVSEITSLAHRANYTFDPMAVEEVVNLTEVLFADHKELLRKEKSLQELVTILNLYVESGWPEALNLLWRLDEAFK